MTIADLIRLGGKLVMLVLVVCGMAGRAVADESPLKPGDRIQMKLVGVPQQEMVLVSGLYTVGSDGTLNLPHLSDRPVKAGGVTRSVLERSIQTAYRAADIYTNPTVVINVDDQGSTTRVVTVLGEVRQSGQVAFRDGLTMLEAIAGSGGRSDFSDMGRVMLIRKGKSTEHDLTKVSESPAVDVLLKPGDKVMVREKTLSFFGR